MASPVSSLHFSDEEMHFSVKTKELARKNVSMLVTLQDMHLHNHAFDLHGSNNSNIVFDVDEQFDGGINALIKGVCIGCVRGNAALKLRKLLLHGWVTSTFFMRYLNVEPWEITAELLVFVETTASKSLLVVT